MRKLFSIVPNVKKVVPVLLATVLFMPLPARAEIKAGSVEISPFAGYNFFEKRQNLKDGPMLGGRLGYNITNTLGIEASGEFIRGRVDDKSLSFTRKGQFTSPEDDVDIIMYHLDLIYHFMPESKLNPFITAGYGAAFYFPWINDKNMSVIDFGVGAKYWLSDDVALRLDIRDNMVLDETIHNIHATVGVVFSFGGVKKTSAAVPREKSADVVKAVVDNTPPEVIFVSPAKGDTVVDVNRKVSVAFSEKMNKETFTGATFTLMQGDTPVSGRIASTDSTATFIPADNFEKGKAYTATLTTGVKDLAGNAMVNNYNWGFTAGQTADTTAPTVTFTSPVNGTAAALVYQNTNVAFSEAMDPGSISAETFTIKQGATPISGRVSSNASTATFAPAKNFEKGKTYTATVTTGARDLAGNPIEKDYVWNFKTFSPPKVLAVLSKLDNSHFNYDSAAISENGKTILNNNVAAMKGDPKMKLLISGYTSASGTEAYNQDLSERRAAAVKVYFVNTGNIDENRFITIGYGENNPAKYEANPPDKLSPEALANMRVIIEVIEE